MSGQREFNVRFLHELAAQPAYIAGDIIEIGSDTWAIHGTIPVDGDVLMAAFAERQEAIAVLDGLK